MKDLMTILRRELNAYFNSPIAYIFLIVFCLVTAGLFMLSFFVIGRIEMRSFFSMLPMMLVVFIPAITMRLWADDRKIGTYELLLTFPMKTQNLVLGKFFASFIFYLIGLATTLPIPIMLAQLGQPDWGPIIGGYFGAIMAGAFFISVGLMISGLCKDQIVAFVLAMVACFAFYMLGTDFVATSVDGWTGSLNLGTNVLAFVAMTKHYAGAERGLVDLRDIIYFVAMTALFLGLNALYLNSRMRPHASSRFTVMALVYVVLVIFLNVVVSGFSGFRYDLTEEKIYTVSDEAKEVTSRLKVPVRVSYYVSPTEKLPSVMKTFRQEVIDKLREFEIASGGNLQVSVHEVEAVNALAMQRRQLRQQVEEQLGSEAADTLVGEKEEEEISEQEKFAEELMRKGVTPFQMETIEADERTTVTVYSSIAVAYKEKDEEVIPQVTPRNFGNLEYELISRIFRLTRDKQPTVAIVAPKDTLDPQIRQMLEMQGMQVPPAEDNFRYLGMLLQREQYDTRRVDFAEKQSIPDEVDTVVAVNPRQWEDRQRWELNRALRSGKSVILGVQMYTQDYQPGARGIQVNSAEVRPGVNELLEEYGVSVSKDFLFDQNHEVLNIQAGQRRGPFSVSTPVELPSHIVLNQTSGNPDVSITSRMGPIFYLWGTTIELDKEKLEANDLKATVLLTSGEQSWTAPFSPGKLTQKNLEQPDQFEPGKPLAVLIEGQFPDVFEDRDRPQWPKPPQQPGQPPPPEDPEEPPAPEIEPQPGRLLLVANGVMWNNDFLETPGNLNLFLNSVDALTLGEELISIRSKTRLERLIPAKLTTAQKAWYRFFVMGLAPVILAVAGILRLYLRKRVKDNYIREVAQA